MTTDASLLRVEKGQAEPEELAAITAILLARAAAQPAAEPRRPRAAGWRRLERQRGFRSAHSWQG
ncbi:MULTISPECIES: acyl-CoA carboxylase subunit epsilon [Streptomyces]|uniref:Acyl-CoA carboxylase subunit epsilon n=1 Tax=Streptomyces chengmaiensis TaxID=3040919 RepID=A0ABT6HWM6_9ACTN|nr:MULTISPECIES: acyl-CoA carboxylase subunit epsilon [Streptomyces]MDH2392703.1 acyl-CoA carboxylase subunit epsilon [Streptomyces chengmaiensis]WRQ81040.1 acyl-CoA carboxylase subunit epsilon [Streptomyces sp. MUM 178J]